ncbi:MAG: adenosine kinase [Spirochaetales bacterium]|jgi:fructokinase|nr:adenosine kinase [Spirochaetales bacterium]
MSVFLMCNPLTDIVIQAPAGMVEELGAVPGSMNLSRRDTIEAIFAKKMPSIRVPGGSGANTARGLAWLNGKDGYIEKPAYLGSAGGDEEGRAFDRFLKEAGVSSCLVFKEGQASGVSVILVSPDHERTMFTYLGACRLLDRSDLPLDALRRTSYLYLTGYNWDTPNQEQAAKDAAAVVKGAGGKVCLDVADPFVAARYRDSFYSWCPGNLDILFANREELAALTGVKSGDDAILKAAAAYAPLVVMKTGREGCAILADGQIRRAAGETVQAVDTTAAGDSFAAGFLFGLLLGKDIELCGKAANHLAAQMVTVEGCDYSHLDREKVLELLRLKNRTS